MQYTCLHNNHSHVLKNSHSGCRRQQFPMFTALKRNPIIPRISTRLCFLFNRYLKAVVWSFLPAGLRPGQRPPLLESAVPAPTMALQGGAEVPTLKHSSPQMTQAIESSKGESWQATQTAHGVFPVRASLSLALGCSELGPPPKSYQKRKPLLSWASYQTEVNCI